MYRSSLSASTTRRAFCVQVNTKRHAVALLEAEHAILERLFPRHVIEHLTTSCGGGGGRGDKGAFEQPVAAPAPPAACGGGRRHSVQHGPSTCLSGSFAFSAMEDSAEGGSGVVPAKGQEEERAPGSGGASRRSAGSGAGRAHAVGRAAPSCSGPRYLATTDGGSSGTASGGHSSRSSPACGNDVTTGEEFEEGGCGLGASASQEVVTIADNIVPPTGPVPRAPLLWPLPEVAERKSSYHLGASAESMSTSHEQV